MQRVDKIEEFVRNETQKLILNNQLKKNGICTDLVSSAIGIDRTNVSRILNQLWKDGKLIKIQGRPILFLDLDTIKSEYPASYIPSTISINSSLEEYTSKVSSTTQNKKKPLVKVNPLERIVGINGSLKEEVKKAISATSYPPYGLPIMLIGNPGSGKRKFITAIYYYALSNQLLAENAPFKTVNCSDYSNNDDLFAKRLLGTYRASNESRSSKGYLESTAHGILYLNGFDKLSLYCQNLVLDCVQNNFFSRVNENNERLLETMIVVSVSDLKNNEFITSLQEYFPIQITIPNIDQRPPMEKIEMILSLFRDEAISIKKTIYIHNSIILLFCLSKFEQNESQLRNEIKSTCAKAFLDTDKSSTSLTIEYSHLSHQILSSKNNTNENTNIFMRTLQMYPEDTIVFLADGSCDALKYYQNAYSLYAYQNRQQFVDSLYCPLFKIKSYNSYICDLIEAVKTCDDDYIAEIQNKSNYDIFFVIFSVLGKDVYYQNILNNTRFLHVLSLLLTKYINENENDIIINNYEKIYAREYQSSSYIINQLQKHGISISCPLKVTEFICNYLYITKRILDKTKTSILVICHGNNTASEICLYASTTASNSDVKLDALNYTNNMQFNDLLELAKLSILRINNGNGVIVLVDTIPLDGLEEYLQKETQTKIKVISGVSLNLLNSVIESCKKCEPIDLITQPSFYNSKNNTTDIFLTRFIDTVISKTALFVNPKKAADCLLYSLQLILKDLNMSYSEEIAVKFLSHSVHMIERIIRNNPLEYVRLKQYTNEHYELMNIIHKNLMNTENTFDIKVPDCEIAYLSEIFTNS